MDELVQALTATGYSFAHFGWSKAPAGDYGVYAEDGANDLIAGDVHAERAIEGTVDYFTRAIDVTEEGAAAPESIPAKAVIESALTAARAAWYLSSIQFEQDTGYVHLEWVFQVMG